MLVFDGNLIQQSSGCLHVLSAQQLAHDFIA